MRADDPLQPSGALGVLGGTFDPIHFGHLRLAEEACEALALERLHLIPAGDPPHRATPLSSATRRLAMVQAAIADQPRFVADDREVRASGKSYTVTTLESLRAECGPQRPLVLVLGADAFNGLAGWYQWPRLFELAHIAVANRPGYVSHAADWAARLPPELAAELHKRLCDTARALQDAPAGHILPFTMTPLDISATLIRATLRAGRSARYLLPDSVLAYIQTHQLYPPDPLTPWNSTS